MDNPTEGIRVTYSGTKKALHQHISNLGGVESVRVGDGRFDGPPTTGEVECTIEYDAESTDRTEIAIAIEEHDGVTGNATFV